MASHVLFYVSVQVKVGLQLVLQSSKNLGLVLVLKSLSCRIVTINDTNV